MSSKSSWTKTSSRGGSILGIALQAYLKSAQQDVRRVIDWARQRNRRINIRLVGGVLGVREDHRWSAALAGARVHRQVPHRLELREVHGAGSREQ